MKKCKVLFAFLLCLALLLPLALASCTDPADSETESGKGTLEGESDSATEGKKPGGGLEIDTSGTGGDIIIDFGGGATKAPESESKEDSREVTADDVGFYDWESSKPYMDVTDGAYRGLCVDMAAFYEKHVASTDMARMEITDGLVAENVKYLSIGARTAAANKGKVVGHGDDLALFILSATAEKDGAQVNVDGFFVNAYSSYATLTVGAELFGEGFDLAFTGKDVTDHFFSEDEDVALGDIAETNVVRMYFTAKAEGAKAPYMAAEGERYLASDPVVQAFLTEGAGKKTGDTVSFTRTEDTDGDGTNETVTYEGCVISVVTEKPFSVTARLPENFIAAEDEENLWLNGKEVTMACVVYSFTDYDCPTPDVLTPADVDKICSYWGLGTVEADKSDAVGYVAALSTLVRGILEEQKAAAVASYEQAAYWEAISELYFKSTPAGSVAERYFANVKKAVEEEYNYNAGYYTDFKEYYPTVDSFAADYFGYDGEEFATLDACLTEHVRVEYNYQSFVYGVMAAEGLLPTEDELDDGFEEWIGEAMEYFGATRAQILEYYAGFSSDFARQYVITQKVEKFLLENAVFDYGE